MVTYRDLSVTFHGQLAESFLLAIPSGYGIEFVDRYHLLMRVARKDIVESECLVDKVFSKVLCACDARHHCEGYEECQYVFFHRLTLLILFVLILFSTVRLDGFDSLVRDGSSCTGTSSVCRISARLCTCFRLASRCEDDVCTVWELFCVSSSDR